MSENRVSASTTFVHDCIIYMLMRDAEGRKKEARSYKQQGKATRHTQGSHFSKELPQVGMLQVVAWINVEGLFQAVNITGIIQFQVILL